MDNSRDSAALEYARFFFQDASDRLRFQHEYALGGFRTLILINGGAIVGLLTYAGNVLDKAAARGLSAAFIWYAVGLGLTTFSYLLAYFSQSFVMAQSTTEAYLALGVVEDPDKAKSDQARSGKRGAALISAGIVLVVSGLVCFVVGSICAMGALT